MEIRRATTVGELTGAEYLFDRPVRPEWAQRFLEAGGHHLFLAYETPESGGPPEPVGFVSGVETVHPDKGTEMFLYELAVAEPYRRRGAGRALTRTLAALARERGCYGMWVGVDTGNDVALATYRSAGGEDDGTCTVVVWDFAPEAPPRA
ncbi:GNAT family N-acetyltransferase [Streptomyces sp. NPDC086783]|uniref:GNAT family N-acetyltransferase n=1 Tax=Streptomyces sp. NPDC086783 TaxID=3365758 RepID=UPI00382C512D